MHVVKSVYNITLVNEHTQREEKVSLKRSHYDLIDEMVWQVKSADSNYDLEKNQNRKDKYNHPHVQSIANKIVSEGEIKSNALTHVSTGHTPYA